MLPRALHNVKSFPLCLKVIEKLGIGEKQSEEFINIDGKVLADNLPGILILPLHLISKDVCGHNCRAVQGSWLMTGIILMSIRMKRISRVIPLLSRPCLTHIRLVSQCLLS